MHRLLSFRPWPLLVSLLALMALMDKARALDIGRADNSEISRTAQAVLAQAYAKAGIEFRPILLPLRRSQIMAERGETDGELMRAAEVLSDMPHLIRIDVPVVYIVITAYRRGECPRRTSAAELSQQRVAYHRGTRLIERMLPANALVPTHDSRDAIRALQAEMADTVLGADVDIDNLLLSQGVRGICKVSEPLSQTPLYHALNRRHAAMAARLELVLKDMQSSGELVRIWAAEDKRVREDAVRQAGTPR